MRLKSSRRSPAQTVNKGESAELTVSSYFSDPDEDDLEYTVSSSDTAKVTVAVNGAVVTFSGVAKGDATVTVTASDGDLTVQQGFAVTVPNRAPEAVGTVPAQTVNKGASADLTVSSYFSDPDEDDLEYTAVSSDTAKVTVAVNGAVVTLSGVAKGDATVTVTASDGDLTAQQGFAVTVPNRAPEAVGTVPAQTVNKGESAELTVSSYFSDPDEDTLEYTVASSDTAKVTVAVTGAVVTLTGVAQGDATVTVTASDGDLTVQQGFAVTVPNGAPEAVGTIGAQTVNKGASLDLTVSSYFSDPDEDDLEYTAVSSDTAKVSVGVTGAVVTLTGVAKGEATVTVTASDGNLTAQQGFTVTVPNGGPITVDTVSAQTVNKGESLDLTVSSYFSDPDEDDLEYTAVSSDTAKVSVGVTGAVVTLTGVAKGEATVTVTASDGDLTAQQGFTVTVPNGAPEAVGTIGAQTVNKGESLDLTVSSYFSDPDEDDLEYTAVSSDTAKVSVGVTGAVVTLTGVAKGEATVTVTASDGNLTAQQGFTVTVPNGGPITVDTVSAQTVNKGESLDLTVSSYFSDPDEDDLEYTAVSSDTAKVTVGVTGAVVTLSGVAKGEATVTVTASDGDLTAQQGFTVTVPNGAPEAVGTTQTVNKGESLDLTVSSYFSDPDEDDLEYTAVSSDTAKVSVGVTGAVVTLTGVAKGEATVTVTASDGNLTAQQGFTVTVPNGGPITVDTVSAQTVNKGESLDLTVSSYFSDPDEDDLEYTAVSSDTAKVSVGVTGAVVTLTGVAKGEATVTVTASDGDLTAQQGFTVTVPNGAPEAVGTIGAQTVNKGESLDLTVSSYFSDPDEDDLEYTAVSSDTAKVTVAVNGAVVTLTGVAKGDATVTVTASDGDLTAEQGFTVTVPNGAPVCSNIPAQTLWVNDDLTVNLSAYCSDPDDDPLTYTASSSVTSKVTESVSGSTLTLTGNALGSSTITVTARDNPGDPQDSLSTIETFTATVKNRAPDCTFNSQTLDLGQSKDLGVTAHCTDADGHSMTYTAASSSNSNIVSVERRNNNTVVRITGESAGTATVTVTVADGHGGSTTKSFSVTVKPSCDLSSIGNQTIFMGDSRRLSLSSACNGTYSASSSNTNVVTESVSGSTLTISGVAVGTATVTVRARKSGYTDDSVTFTVRVKMKPSCDLSSIGNQTIIINKSKTISLSSACNGTYSASSSNTNVVTESVSGGTLTIRGVALGTATVTVRVEKTGYKPDSVSFTVTVTPPPPDPRATLTASSTTLDADGCTILTWTTTNANSASINHNVGTVTPTPGGSIEVCPGEEKEYTLTANGDPRAENPIATAGVTVKPSCDLSSIGNQTIIINKSKTISLSSACNGTYSASSSNTNVVTESVSGGTLTIRGVALGTATVTVRVEKTGYKPDSVSFTVTVTPPPPDPRATLTASSTTLDADGCTILTWTTTNANSASINHNVGTVTPTPGGSIEVCPGEEKEYTLTANGDPRAENPIATAGVTVKPSCDLSSIGNQTIIINKSKTISLSSACNGTYSASSSNTNVVTESVSGGTLTIRGVALGTATVTVRVEKTGYKPDSVSFTVTVTPPPPDPRATLTASSTTLDADGCTILTWTTTNANSASINHNVGTVTPTPGGSIEVCPGEEKEYTLTANGDPRAENPIATAGVTVKPSCDLSSIGNQTIIINKSKTISLSSACNGTYSASSSNTNVVTESVSGGTLTIRGVALGTATVTVRVEKTGYKPDSVSFTVTVTPPPPDPRATLTASSTTLDADGCTILTWTTTNANSASINHNVGTVTPTPGGSIEVCPGEEKEYTLTANGDPRAENPIATAGVTVKPSCDLSSIGNQTIIINKSKTISPLQRLQRDLQRQLVEHECGDGVGERRHLDDPRGCARDGDGDGEGGEDRDIGQTRCSSP